MVVAGAGGPSGRLFFMPCRGLGVGLEQVQDDAPIEHASCIASFTHKTVHAGPPLEATDACVSPTSKAFGATALWPASLSRHYLTRPIGAAPSLKSNRKSDRRGHGASANRETEFATRKASLQDIARCRETLTERRPTRAAPGAPLAAIRLKDALTWTVA